MIIDFMRNHRRLLGWLLILLSFCIGLLMLRAGIFNDEPDNLAAGRLILQGKQLYRDIFSHHFPFATYWSAMAIAIFGPAINLLRLSLLIFQTLAFVAAMLVTGEYLTVGAIAVLWAAFKYIYSGNMILYSSFAGVSVAVVFIIVLNLLLSAPKPSRWREYTAIGAFSLIALLSDPLTVYALAIAYLVLLIKHPPMAVYSAILPTLGLVAYEVYLFASGNLAFFLDEVMVFNAQTYAQYKFTSPLRFTNLFHLLISGLAVFEPFSPDVVSFFHSPQTLPSLLNWLFVQSNGLEILKEFLKISTLALTVYFAFSKKFLAAIFVYTFTAATLLINESAYNSQTFVAASLAGIVFFFASAAGSESRHRPAGAAAAIGASLFFQLIGAAAILSVVNLPVNFQTYESTAQYDQYIADNEHYREITCDLPGVKLAHYPVGGYHYWFTSMQPVARYLYMWPWVAEYGQGEVIRELGSPNELALVVVEHYTVWQQYDSDAYLKPLIDFLDANYRKVEDRTYISPALAAACPLYTQ